MKLYTGENCSLCDQAKIIIENKSIDIEIEMYDPSKREHRELHAMWVPIIKHDDTVLIGPDVITYLNNFENASNSSSL